MTRYALIDNCSGFVFWVGNADDPLSACEKADTEIGNRDVEYEEQSRPVSNETGYFVYEVPDDFDVDDGQDQKQIEAVESHGPHVAYVRVTENEQ